MKFEPFIWIRALLWPLMSPKTMKSD